MTIPAPAPQPELARARTLGRAWYSLLGLGLAIGAFAFFYQWANGLGVTGLSNTVSWGLYIVAFMFLVGISAGGLIVVAGSELVGSDRFEPLSRIAVVCSATAVAGAAGSILPDLGRPEMFWKMLVNHHWTSPLMWDMVVITIYLAIALTDLYVLTRPGLKRSTMKRLAIVTLPVAILVHSVTAWIFGLLVARPFWNSPLLAPLFISSALVSGTAFVILVAHFAARYSSFDPPDRVFPDLGRLMVWFIGVDAFLLFTEILTTYTSHVPDHIAQLDVVLWGRLAPLFWTEVALGLAVPFAIFARPKWRARRSLLVVASVLALVGVFLKRINILFSSEFEPLVGLQPGIPGGRPGQPFTPDQVYIPSWVEVGVLIGMAAFVLAAITIGVRKIVIPHKDDPPPAPEAEQPGADARAEAAATT